MLIYCGVCGSLWWKAERPLRDAKVSKRTLVQARKLAQDFLVNVRGGADPSQERQAARTAPTVKDLADRFIVEHSEARNKPLCATSRARITRSAPQPRRSPPAAGAWLREHRKPEQQATSCPGNLLCRRSAPPPYHRRRCGQPLGSGPLRRRWATIAHTAAVATNAAPLRRGRHPK